MSLIWGIPYLLIKVAVDDFSVVQIVFLRAAIGALLLLPIVVRRRALAGLTRHWRPVALFAVAEIVIPWWLLTDAERHLPSSFTALLISTVPFFGAALAHFGGDERLTTRRLIGLGVGVLGLVALLGLDLSHISVIAVCEVLGVAFGYAFAPWVASRHLTTASTFGVLFASLAGAAIVYAGPAFLDFFRHEESPSTAGMLSVLGLGVVCTAIAFVVFFALIGEVGPARATVITFVNPAVALLAGVVVLDEHLTAGSLVGFALILIGCALSTRRTRPAAERSAAPSGRAIGSPPR